MAALDTYFDYEVCEICGIPRITLLGTQADWQSSTPESPRGERYTASSGGLSIAAGPAKFRSRIGRAAASIDFGNGFGQRRPRSMVVTRG